MKIERLNHDKIRIFLTFDDLSERGIQKDDMWREIPKVHELFSEMMDQAYTEVGFDASGPLAVEVFSTPAQGMIVVVTRGKGMIQLDDDYDSDDVYEVELTIEQTDMISYAFNEFDELVLAAESLLPFFKGGRLYNYKGIYILQIDSDEMNDVQANRIVALLSEFAEVSPVTPEVLEEYGKVVMPELAVETICRYF
jgi:adapter protein MecA 1/2